VVEVSVDEGFGHVDVVHPGDLDHHQGVVRPVNVATHPVDGQSLTVVDSRADDHFSACPVQLPPLDGESAD